MTECDTCGYPFLISGRTRCCECEERNPEPLVVEDDDEAGSGGNLLLLPGLHD